MLRSREFWFGVIVGVGLTYVYHRFAGIPTNAPVKPA